jgi:hypothetical protein
MFDQVSRSSQRADARNYREIQIQGVSWPRRIARAVVPAVALVMFVLGGVAFAGAPNSSIRITGPKAIKHGTTIELKGSGFTGQATSVFVYLDVKGKCAKTARAQKGKALTFGPFSKNKKFKFPLPPLTPGNPPTSLGSHNVCAFLAAPSAKKTYAHAGFTYTVHN